MNKNAFIGFYMTILLYISLNKKIYLILQAAKHRSHEPINKIVLSAVYMS